MSRESYYGCRDYLHSAATGGSSSTPRPSTQRKSMPESTYSSATDLVSMVEEFANVVTDHAASTHRNTSSTDAAGSIVSKSPSTASFNDVQDVDKMDVSSSSSNQSTQQQTESFRYWRQQMFDWACMVVDSFAIDRDVVAVSFNLLDRYMASELFCCSSNQDITRDDFQLFSMTCLYMAIKVLQPYPKKLGVEALVDMSRGFYTEKDIVATERDILTALSWHVNPTTALAFSGMFWSLVPLSSSSKAVPDDMRLTALTLCEIAVADSFFVSHRASLVGLAAVMIAARLHGFSDEKVHGLLANLEDIVCIQDNSELGTIYRQLELLYCQ